MIPIRDDIPSRKFPIVTLGLIIFNTAIFIIEVALSPSSLRYLVSHYGLVPRYVFTEYVPFDRSLFSFVSAIFLHGGWFHLIGNMWYLWIFGDNVEDRLGHFKFLLFFIACGVFGNFAHFVFNSNSPLPAIGASGAIAGVLGGYVISYPNARILVIFPFFYFFHFIEVPALIVLGFWFIVQFLNGFASVVVSSETGGVAWWAHIGGFIGGMLFLKFLRPRPRVVYRIDEDIFDEF